MDSNEVQLENDCELMVLSVGGKRIVVNLEQFEKADVVSDVNDVFDKLIVWRLINL